MNDVNVNDSDREREMNLISYELARARMREVEREASRGRHPARLIAMRRLRQQDDQALRSRRRRD